MKIVFTGAHSVGKSTLAEVTAGRYGLPYVEETARRVFRDRGITTANQTLLTTEQRIALQEDILLLHLEQVSERPHGFVSDRCEVDVLAYSLFWLGMAPEAQAWLTQMQRVVAEHREFYDAVILVQPGIPVKPDGLRIIEPGHQWTIHYLIEGILQTHGYDYYVLTTTDPAKRDAEIQGILNRVANRLKKVTTTP